MLVVLQAVTPEATFIEEREAGSSTLPAHKNTYELEHRNCVMKMFFQHEIVTHYHTCQNGERKIRESD